MSQSCMVKLAVVAEEISLTVDEIVQKMNLFIYFSLPLWVNLSKIENGQVIFKLQNRIYMYFYNKYIYNFILMTNK